MTRKPLNDLPLSKVEKTLSDLKMRLDNLPLGADPDIDLHNTSCGWQICVRSGDKISGVLLNMISRYCERKGLIYYVDNSNDDLRIEIF